MRRTPLCSLNDELIRELEKIERNRYLTSNERSALSYRRAIAALRAFPKKIEGEGEAAAIKGIGIKISHMIGEWLRTGKIIEAEMALDDPIVRVSSDLTRIHGVGPKAAEKFINDGIESVVELRAAVTEGRFKLPKDQAIGLHYLDDLEKPISREAIEAFAEEIKKTINEAALPKCRVEIVGGYRRGKEKNNDIDILISPIRQEGVDGILKAIVDKLEERGIMKGILQFNEDHAHAKVNTKKGSTMDRFDKCLCVILPPGGTIHHRADIIVSPRSQFPFAMLGWTGSRQFERSIRLYADREKGMSLSSHALTDDKTGQPFPAESEEEIFKLLGLEYIEPKYRNC